MKFSRLELPEGRRRSINFCAAVHAVFTGMALLLTPPHCSQRPALSPACNVAAYVDQWIMGQQHLYPFPTCRHAKPPCPYLDPEVV